MEFMAIEVLLELLEDFLYTHRRWWLTHLFDFLIDLDMSHSPFFLAYDQTQEQKFYSRAHILEQFFSKLKYRPKYKKMNRFLCSLQTHKNGYCKDFLMQLNIKPDSGQLEGIIVK